MVWITGASSGLGFYTAKALVDAGFTVIAGARSFAQKAEEDAGFVRLPLDVTAPESINAFVRNALVISETVDVLVNCAAILVLGSCEETGLDEYNSVMQTNFIGSVAMIQAALPIMRKQHSGKIINFSSINGLMGVPFQGAYTASKHAMEGFTECLAMEVAPFGIQVCLVEPGDHRSGSQAYRGRAKGMVPGHSPYEAAFAKGTSVIERDEKHGRSPERLGKKVATLAGRRHMPRRKRIAKADQHLAVLLHDTIPNHLFSFIISHYYVGKGEPKHAKEKPHTVP